MIRFYHSTNHIVKNLVVWNIDNIRLKITSCFNNWIVNRMIKTKLLVPKIGKQKSISLIAIFYYLFEDNRLKLL